MPVRSVPMTRTVRAGARVLRIVSQLVILADLLPLLYRRLPVTGRGT